MKSGPANLPSLAILGICASALAGLLFSPVPFAPSSPGGMAFFDALHFPLFTLLTILIYAFLRKADLSPPRHCLIYAIALAILAAAMSELLQSLFERTSSWRDFGFDLIGIAAATATIFLIWKRHSPAFGRIAIGVAALYIVSTVAVTLPAWRAVQAQQRQALAFPRLGDFEHEWESLFWHPQGETDAQAVTATRAKSDHSSKGSFSLLIETNAASWAGVHLLFGKRRPWSGKRILLFDLFNPADRFELGVRIDGFDGGRYSGAVQIEPGSNSCRLPFEKLANREASLAELNQFEAKQLTFHLGKPLATRTFYLDNVRLE